VGVQLVSVFSLDRFRVARALGSDVKHARHAAFDERRSLALLYPRVHQDCSGAVPSAWAGVSPALLAEFQVGEFDFPPRGAA
jgi:hypothetical protein